MQSLEICYSPISCGNKEINELKHRLKDNFAQIWKTNIIKFNNTTNKNENKLRTYSKFKTIFKQEEYLNIKDFKMRSILTHFRISAHKLEIETGRYVITNPKTPLENRLCKQCNLSEIEDEEHFLINCPKYTLFLSNIYIFSFNFPVLLFLFILYMYYFFMCLSRSAFCPCVFLAFNVFRFIRK